MVHVQKRPSVDASADEPWLHMRRPPSFDACVPASDLNLNILHTSQDSLLFLSKNARRLFASRISTLLPVVSVHLTG